MVIPFVTFFDKHMQWCRWWEYQYQDMIAGRGPMSILGAGNYRLPNVYYCSFL
jgi:hypothetical protein